MMTSESELQNSDPQLNQVCQGYEQVFQKWNKKLLQLMTDEANHLIVTTEHQKLSGHLSAWLEYLRDYIGESGLDVQGAKLGLTQVKDKLKACDMIYRQYLDSCVAATSQSVRNSEKELPTTQSRISRSSTSSSMRRERSMMLKLKASQKRAEADLKASQEKKISELKRAEAELKAQVERAETEIKAKFMELEADLLDQLENERTSSRASNSLHLPINSDENLNIRPAPRQLRDYAQPVVATEPQERSKSVPPVLGDSDAGICAVQFSDALSVPPLPQFQSSPVSILGDQIAGIDNTSDVTNRNLNPSNVPPRHGQNANRSVVDWLATAPCSVPPVTQFLAADPLLTRNIVSTTLPSAFVPLTGDAIEIDSKQTLRFAPEVNTNLVSSSQDRNLPHDIANLTNNGSGPSFPHTGPVHIASGNSFPYHCSMPAYAAPTYTLPSHGVPYTAQTLWSQTHTVAPIASTGIFTSVTNRPTLPAQMLTTPSLTYQNAPNLAPVQLNPHGKAASKDDLYLLGRRMEQQFYLPKLDRVEFTGDPLEFDAFIQAFDSTIGSHTSDPAMLLAQLIQHCKGEARDVIKHLRLSDDPAQAIQIARDTLQFHFGNRPLVINTFIEQLTEGPPIRNNDVKELCKLSSQMRDCSVILRNWNAQCLLDAPAYLSAIFRRLPHDMRNDYVLHGTWTAFAIPSFDDLLKFIEIRARLYNTFYGRALAEQSNKPKGPRNTRPA